MPFQDDPAAIRWRLHLRSSPDTVYQILASSEGRERFWAESAPDVDRAIEFCFPNGQHWRGRILESAPFHCFAVEYLGSVATFELRDDSAGGTDLTLTDTGVPDADRLEVVAGWVSVLLALKAAVDFGVDLRNHDPERTWDQGYADN
ncbi:MAG TPA: SRPBCC domain-containing protein [Ardenticatenaceae bacterium]|nr:SRPBCC domain-containing protein [Ardenticatenaceae bacterium]